MRTKRSFLSLSVAFAGVAVAALLPASISYGQTPCRYEIAHIIKGPHCGFDPSITEAVAISPNGRWVVGIWYCSISGNVHAFVLDTTTGIMTNLPMPPGLAALDVNDVNDSGIMVGTAEDSTGQYGYLYDIEKQEMIVQIPPGYPGPCRVTSINTAGAVCGYRRIAGPPTNPENAFIWSAETGVIDLGVMNGPGSRATEITDNGLVVGWTGTGSSPADRAFSHQNGRIVIWPPVPGGFTSLGHGANEAGQIIITGRVGVPDDSVLRSFVAEGETWTELMPLSGHDTSSAIAISESGEPVGVSTSSLPGNQDRPCIWFDGQPVNLASLSGADPTMHALRLAVDISDDGRIIVWGITITGGLLGQVSYLLAPVLSAPGDTNCDEIVNVIDLLAVVGHWGPCDQCPTDLTQDGAVNLLDLLIVIEHWSS